MSNFYTFSAIRGVQAGHPYFTVMIPLGQVPRIFSFDDETLPPDLRSQRVLSKVRVPQIAEYLAVNWDNYTLSSLCASIDGDLQFKPASDDIALRNVGILTVAMDARILLNDGQHRRAAIEEALKSRPELENETISVVLFADRGLERSQQMFADLNKNAVRPSGSLNVLFDHRSPLSQLSAFVLSEVEFFRRFTDLERSSIPNRGTALYTLSSLNRANQWFAGNAADRFGAETRALAAAYWSEVYKVMPDWQRLDAGTQKSVDLRQGTVLAHGVLLQALGLLGGRLLTEKPKSWRKSLAKLENLDWSRRNAELWEGRVMNGARMNGQKRAVQLGANVLFGVVGLPLDERARHAENALLSQEAA